MRTTKAVQLAPPRRGCQRGMDRCKQGTTVVDGSERRAPLNAGFRSVATWREYVQSNRDLEIGRETIYMQFGS